MHPKLKVNFTAKFNFFVGFAKKYLNKSLLIGFALSPPEEEEKRHFSTNYGATQ